MVFEPAKDKVDFETVVDELARKVVQLQSELERKNQAIEGLLAENEALKEELGGRKRKAAPGPESLEARVERWKQTRER